MPHLHKLRLSFILWVMGHSLSQRLTLSVLLLPLALADFLAQERQHDRLADVDLIAPLGHPLTPLSPS